MHLNQIGTHVSKKAAGIAVALWLHCGHMPGCSILHSRLQRTHTLTSLPASTHLSNKQGSLEGSSVGEPGSQGFARCQASTLQACSITGRCNSRLASRAGRIGSTPGSAQRSEARLVYALGQAGPIAAHVMRVYAKKMPQACEQHASSVAHGGAVSWPKGLFYVEGRRNLNDCLAWDHQRAWFILKMLRLADSSPDQ